MRLQVHAGFPGLQCLPSCIALVLCALATGVTVNRQPEAQLSGDGEFAHAHDQRSGERQEVCHPGTLLATAASNTRGMG
eukprot:1160959-Pelagomonas_calceolata.AAC.10